MTPENINIQQEQINTVEKIESTKDKMEESSINEETAKDNFNKTLSKLAGRYEMNDINKQLDSILSLYEGDKNSALINLNSASLKDIMNSKLVGGTEEGINVALKKILESNEVSDVPIKNNIDMDKYVEGIRKNISNKETAEKATEENLKEQQEIFKQKQIADAKRQRIKEEAKISQDRRDAVGKFFN